MSSNCYIIMRENVNLREVDGNEKSSALGGSWKDCDEACDRRDLMG